MIHFKEGPLDGVSDEQGPPGEYRAFWDSSAERYVVVDDDDEPIGQILAGPPPEAGLDVKITEGGFEIRPLPGKPFDRRFNNILVLIAIVMWFVSPVFGVASTARSALGGVAFGIVVMAYYLATRT